MFSMLLIRWCDNHHAQNMFPFLRVEMEKCYSWTVDNYDHICGPSIITTPIITEGHGNYEPHANSRF